MHKDFPKIAIKPNHKKIWVKKVKPINKDAENYGCNEVEGRGISTQESPRYNQDKGKKILIPEEDVISAMQGGNGKGKVTGSSKEEDGDSVSKDNGE